MVGGRNGVVIGSALLLVLTACASDEGAAHGAHPCPPECPDESIEEDEHALPQLTREQLERYHGAQVAWRDCAMAEGLTLPEPPSFEEFAAEGGTWWVGYDMSNEEWNSQVVGSGGSGRVGERCGEPPTQHEFSVSDEAIRRLYAWQEQVVACLEAEGFPVDTTAPPIEEFVESGGANWTPARDFHRRYGFLEGATWVRVSTRCGNASQDLWLQARDFEVDRPVLRAGYQENLELTACLEEAGLRVPQPPSWEEFVDHLGSNWTNDDIWGAVYGDNERRSVRLFVDRMDQVCPGVS